MLSRITLLLLTLFWLTMSFLLWRSEYVGENQVGASVPVGVIWRKIRTAPDPSPLQILHNGVKVGYCKWASSVNQDIIKNKLLTDDATPDAAPPAKAATQPNYRLNFDGNLALPNLPGRIQFESEIKLGSNNDTWDEFHFKVGLRPSVWEIHSKASEQTARLVMDDHDGRFEHIFKFGDLQNPQTLMDEFNLPAQLGLLGMLAPLPKKSPPGAAADPGLPPELGLQWTAHNDWVTIGHTSVRTFRLEATLLERYRMRIIVSRVGEILRVELPDGWELVNDQLVAF
jgi:hypothetical protein